MLLLLAKFIKAQKGTLFLFFLGGGVGLPNFSSEGGVGKVGRILH